MTARDAGRLAPMAQWATPPSWLHDGQKPGEGLWKFHGNASGVHFSALEKDADGDPPQRPALG